MPDQDLVKLAEGERSHWSTLVRIAFSRVLAIPEEERRGSPELEIYCALEGAHRAVTEAGTTRTHADVILFKPSGKYYTSERWRIPKDAIGPYDMWRSPDFRRIGGGAVLIETQEPWGFPHLFPGIDAYEPDAIG